MKVYAVVLDWEFRGDRGTSFNLYATREKAQEMLEQCKQEEFVNSWISEIEDIEELENYEDELEYFDCCQYDRRTTIWIEEKVVE
jgi:hypothetical protein